MKLCIPERCLGQHLVMLGKTGAGKSSALRHLVEYLLAAGKRVCVVDPKGDWWGLKSSADGKSAGLPVIAFGDFKEPKAQDVPINEHSGKHVAELVATGNRPCIIGFRGWMTGPMVRFWIDFASTLFNKNAGELYLVGDEFHNFAPKGKIMDPEAGKCLHWSNRLLAEGRGLGIVCMLASQRPQKVHNDTLTGCETLVAMRVVHEADRNAVAEWIKGCGDSAIGNTVLANLAGMARGEAYVWSPEIGFGPERVRFPMFTTFDSFAPPQLQKTVSAAGWADVDLDEVKQKLAAVIEQAKAEDPRELRKRIGDLQRQLADRPSPPVMDPREVESQIQTAVERAVEARESLWKATVSGIRRNLADAMAAVDTAVGKVEATPTPHPPRPAPRPALQAIAKHRPAATGDTGTVGNSGLRRMLIALAQRPTGLDRRQLGVRAGLSSQSGTFGTYLGRGRSEGWIDGGPERLVITPAGLKALGDYDPLPTGRELLAYWLGELGNSGAARMLQALAEAYPRGMSREELGEAAGISSASGTFGTYLGRLRALELVTGRGELKAAEELFD